MSKTVLFIDHDYERTGSTVSLEYLVRAFKDGGYTVFVQTPKKKEVDAKPLRVAGAVLIDYGKWDFTSLALSLHFSHTVSPVSWKGFVTNIKEFVKFFVGILIVRKAIKQTHADLVYVNEYVVPQASIAARLCGVPAVMHIRSPFIKGVFGSRRHLISRLVLRYNEMVFAITPAEAEQLRPRGAERLKIKVVGEFFSKLDADLIDPNRWRNLFDVPKEKKIVSMLGGILTIKGTLDFLRAAQIVLNKRDDVVFVIAGKNWRDKSEEEQTHADQCMQIAKSFEARNAVRIVGEITNSLELIAASDIVVSPTTQTHFSRPIIEAWGFGKPVIATRTEHMIDLISNGVNGLLVEVKDHEALAKSILMLLQNEGLCRALGSAGKKRAAVEFNAETNARTILASCTSLPIAGN